MRNRLKRSKDTEDTANQSRDHPAVVILLSESSCSDGEASLSAEDKHGPNSAAAVSFSERNIQPLQEKRKTLYAKGGKIAPIFLRTFQHSRVKRSNHGELEQPAERTQKSEHPPTVLELTVRHRSGVSTQGRQLSPSALHSCLQEIQTSNPAFPVQTVFSTLQKKASERLQVWGPTAEPSLQYHSREKRKRGNEISERVPKCLRSSHAAEGAVDMGRCQLSSQDVQESPVHSVKKQPRSSKLSRSHKLKQQRGSRTGLVNHSEPSSGSTNHTESDVQQVSCFEDALWTDKYSPQHSSEIIGNADSVNKLHSWLKKWKLKADRDERSKMVDRKREENSSDAWDCGDFQGEAESEDDGEEPLCNTMIIIGPSGVGKTASAYACAQELGFKVFEVNCSSQRNGRHILSQLKEATQSHLVDISGKDPLKPAYINNYSTNSCNPKSEALSGKTMLPKNIISTSKKRAARSVGCSFRKVKAKPATVTLAHYFKMKAKADQLHFGGQSPSEKADGEELGNSSPGSDQTVPQNKKTATSLILFEEVDVIFDDDVGFLAAIKAFMTTTKRPVILTTNDPLFKERFDCNLEETVFKTPSAVNVCSYLQLVCLAEKVWLDLEDVRSLLRLTCGDVRRCLLQLQLWVCGARRSQSESFPQEMICARYLTTTEEGGSSDSQLPSGCSADMLGLHHVTLNHLLGFLKCQFWSETDMNKLLKLLTGSWRRGVPLLYSNLEHLLNTLTFCGLQGEPASTSDCHFLQQNQRISPKESATNSKSVRNISRLSRKKNTTTVFDATSHFNLTHTPHTTSCSLNGTPSRVASSSNKTEQNAARVVNGCLDALTDFFDLMSYLDATLPAAEQLVSGSCTPEAFLWTGAKLKDGFLDEVSEEEGRCWSQESLLLDLQAAVEGLGCRRCWWRVSEAWTEAQDYRQEMEDKRWRRLVESLTLTASSKRHSLSFSLQPLCAPSVYQRRYKLSRTVLNSKHFSLLGNRQAVNVEYMPVLRTICRSHAAQQQEEPARCLTDLSTYLGLSKSTMKFLAEDFSDRKVWKDYRTRHPHSHHYLFV